MQTNGSRPTLGGMVFQHVIVFLVCVAFPGGVTMMAPATWLTFERGEEGVRCTTRTCAFFVVPFKVQRVDQVIQIGQRERAGRTERQRKSGRTTNNTVQVDGEGFLQIHGVGDQHIEVSVSPASLESVAAKSNDFLRSSKEPSTSIFAIANWKFGGLMGGVLTLFTLLYVVGYTLGFLKWMVTGMRKIFTMHVVTSNSS
ncbi:MAG: hypothetical protein ACTHOU_22405 [Aureliella sp.]